MLASEDLILLIKSRCPVIFVESIDEQYVINQLKQIASQFALAFYQWSVTTGLQKGSKEGGFYQTGEPEKMVKTVLSLVRDRSEPGLFAWMSADFTASISGRPSRIFEGRWASFTICLPCACGSMR